MNINELKLLAEQVEEGENRYMTCPACGREGKFSMKVQDGVAVYHCFRASCSLHGGGAVSVSGARLVRTRPAPRTRDITPFTGELSDLPPEWVSWLSNKYHTSPGVWGEWGARFAPEECRVAYPIRNPLGVRRGWVLRAYDGSSPKSLTRMDVDEPHLAWFHSYPDSPMVLVVEDWVSAMRASRYANTVALLGTGCNEDYAQEIAAHKRRVVWALDADATQQSLRLEKKYRLFFDSSMALLLGKDFKDESEEELRRILS